ncbi:reverse transcriptase domain-containing protein [Pectinatus frisingensis]|uniref:reverse transcriptase domain-containing protein n=2 Tax=Pectinatus frisingensis TaxID=865 RepID=UPI0018C6DCBB|nr:reverse transcriptase domain-containing protein [Pectinatus frisingensis]
MCEQYKKFLSIDNFKLAYIRLKTIKRNSYKNFFYEDFKVFEYDFEINIKQLCMDVKNGIYKPQSVNIYYIPKNNALVRPITLLSLFDQIIYQAVANIIADQLYDRMSQYFNSTTFGNIFIKTTDDNPIFFFEKWKTQWKRFHDEIKKNYKCNYKYNAKFDIASFYDTIDHNILCTILKQYGIDDKLIEFLRTCLNKWCTSYTSRFTNYEKKCGIPQGPACSAFFAEVYLFPLDEIMRQYKSIHYFRYADDINIMAKSKMECRQKITLLDLTIRDLALIPQSGKIEITYIDNIGKFINYTGKNFSKIVRSYNQNSHIASKEHNKLKKDIQKSIQSGEVDKTLFKFSLFKFNKDPEIKECILNNKDQFELFFDGVTYYLDKYYHNDQEVEKFVYNYLVSNNALKYNKALLFKQYINIPFDQKILDCNIGKENYFWIVKYFLIDWLKRNDKIDLIKNICKDDTNYFIKRKKLYTEISASEIESKKFLLKEMMNNDNYDDSILALHAYYMWNQEFMYENMFSEIELKQNVNHYIHAHISENITDDYFSYNMKKIYDVEIPNKILIYLKNDIEKYTELKNNFQIFIDNKIIDPDKSLQNLDLVHALLLDYAGIYKNTIPIDFNSISSLNDKLPMVVKVFSRIHKLRCECTSAHYKTSANKLRKRISKSEYEKALNDINFTDVYNALFNYMADIK